MKYRAARSRTGWTTDASLRSAASCEAVASTMGTVSMISRATSAASRTLLSEAFGILSRM